MDNRFIGWQDRMEHIATYMVRLIFDSTKLLQ